MFCQWNQETFLLRKLNQEILCKGCSICICFNTRWKLSWVNLSNYAPCPHSLATLFIEGCFATTQAKKMVLVSCWVPHTYVILYLVFLLPYYCSLFSLVFFLDMRKALSQDVDKKSIIPLKRPITPDELEYDWCWISNYPSVVLRFNLDGLCACFTCCL
jgi:hypothetical protein